MFYASLKWYFQWKLFCFAESFQWIFSLVSDISVSPTIWTNAKYKIHDPEIVLHGLYVRVSKHGMKPTFQVLSHENTKLKDVMKLGKLILIRLWSWICHKREIKKKEFFFIQHSVFSTEYPIAIKFKFYSLKGSTLKWSKWKCQHVLTLEHQNRHDLMKLPCGILSTSLRIHQNTHGLIS